MEIDRQTLYNQLALVAPGLSTGREVLEQSSCFVFADDTVTTFNNEIACRASLELGGITGAVVAEPLLNMLDKLPDDTLNISVEDGDAPKLVVKGKRRKQRVKMETETLLPVDMVPMPDEDDWAELPEEFCQGVPIVCEVTNKKHNKFPMQCVHFTGTHIEASDNVQMARVRMVLPVEGDFLVRATTIKSVAELQPEWAYCPGGDWAHFATASGCIISCRIHNLEYPNIDQLVDMALGDQVTLPAQLADIIERAQVMSAKTTEATEKVTVFLRPGGMRVVGGGIFGDFEEIVDVAYEGRSVRFLIAPTVLRDLSKAHNTVHLGERVLRAESPSITFVTATSDFKAKD